MSKPSIVIVDPYSSGAMLAEALRARGARCTALESTVNMPLLMRSRFNPGMFVDIIRHAEDYAATLAAVRNCRPDYVIAGFESGVELAERLAGNLGLPCNGVALGPARRDKYLMAEAVSRHGLRTARQFLSDDIDAIVAWTRANLDWPVIVKPPKSVGSDQVSCCHTIDALRQGAERILTQTNTLGSSNPAVLVQEFLAGTEYVVDTVTHAGATKVTAYWKYHRPAAAATGDFVCYDAMTLLPYDGERQVRLRAYVEGVLEALAIRFGPAHCELMWVDGEPVLVEVAARLPAGINATLAGICGGLCQLDETADILLAPDRFAANLNAPACLTRHAVNLFIMPAQTGRLIRIQGIDKIRSLPTLHSYSISAQPGDTLKRVAGLVTLVAADIHAIERDIGVIRELERAGMFEVEALPAANH
ncbi:MAG: ATP-grasp domain-containing protein [Pseudomonadota bacterium]